MRTSLSEESKRLVTYIEQQHRTDDPHISPPMSELDVEVGAEELIRSPR